MHPLDFTRTTSAKSVPAAIFGGHLKKLHLKKRGVFCPLRFPTTSARWKNRVAKNRVLTHKRPPMKKLHLEMRGVFLPPPIPTSPAGIWKNRVAKIEKMLVKFRACVNACAVRSWSLHKSACFRHDQN
jgi:hypothetical protein